MNARVARSRAVAGLALFSLGACSLAPTYRQPVLPVPPSFPTGPAYAPQSDAGVPSYSYVQVFADPRLLAIIDQALANNQDIKAAAANIAAARARYRIQRAELLPEINATAGVTHIDPSRSGSGGTSAQTKNSYTAQASIPGYEVDLFGRIRSLGNAAQDRYFASEAAARATRLALVADVADAWLDYAADSSLLQLAQDTVVAARKSVDLTAKRLNGGIAPRSDLRQAELTLHSAEADVAEQTTALAQDRNALELLVGTPVDTARLATSISDAGAHFAEVPAGLDSSILLRRPDVMQAEYELRATTAEIGAARAALFPQISLTGLLGFTSTALGALFTGDSFAWQAGANASYSIFTGGAGRANIALSKAQRDAALASYRKAIQSAFSDVADALARRGTIQTQLAAVGAQRDAAADNYHLADLRYHGGITSYLESLTAQQALYSAQRTLVTTQLVRANNLVGLYRAIGGDAPGEKDAPRDAGTRTPPVN
ncbi:MAG: efflux transporter outer membrane subunit [Sphingobium sp.]